jgi:hypothetical protein
VLLSLRQEEAEEAVAVLDPERGDVELVPVWGDIFTFADLKDRPRAEVFGDPTLRRRFISSLIEGLSEKAASEYALYQLITTEKPDVVIDAVNTATGIAYQDIYRTSRQAWDALQQDGDLQESLEMLLVTDYVPQLIRHVQVLWQSMVKADTHAYIKIGTSGTGGMGLNIPYTHKEVKPAAAIAWKGIGYGEVLRRGRPVRLYDVTLDEAEPLELGTRFRPLDVSRGRDTGRTLKSVYIDTGENGLFSLEEFAAITTGEQMEFVTPEEIADVVARELLGANTGHDVINALDNAVMGPTYRAGLMRHWALEKLRDLEKRHGVRSVAFENLGPPRLSKLLFEADLLRRTFGTMEAVRASTPPEMSVRTAEEIAADADYRGEIVSIGIPILLPDGRLLRGPECKIPPVPVPSETLEVSEEKVDAWAHAGWVDLREPNMTRWRERFERIKAEIEAIPPTDSSSRYLRDRQFWSGEGLIQPGKVAGWIFATEEKGARMK